MAEGLIRVDVAYATPVRQWLIELEVPAGTTAGEAVRLSGLVEECPGVDTTSIGIFGEHAAQERVLEDGDRVEVYRPLIADPREVRREVARQGRSMGRRK